MNVLKIVFNVYTYILTNISTNNFYICNYYFQNWNKNIYFYFPSIKKKNVLKYLFFPKNVRKGSCLSSVCNKVADIIAFVI